FVPRRRFAARGAGAPGRRAWVRRAGADRPRRRLRLARVRAGGKGLRGAADHRRRGDAGGRGARDALGRIGRGLREPLPVVDRGDARRNAVLRELAEALGVATVATGDVHAHDRRLTALQDALVAVKNRTSLDGCEAERRGNRESFLRPPAEIAELFPHDRDAVERSGELAERLRFDLNEDLGYRYPDFSENGEPAIAQLAAVCNRAFTERYSKSNGHKQKARARLDEELKLIDELGLAGFFLLHWEVLALARDLASEVRGRDSPRSTLPTGRGGGSCVGSSVCYMG